MPKTIYVIGHKSPDPDCVCAAIAYAELRRLQGEENFVPARQGELDEKTRFVLRRFGVPEPILLSDVRPRVKDAMSTHLVTANPTQPLLEVGRLFERHNIRAVPVTDASGQLKGLISVEDFAKMLFEGLDLTLLDKVPLELDNIVSALRGRVIVEAKGRRWRDKVMVGAMQLESLVQRLEPGIVLVVGDQEDAQRAAIERGVGALIVTGGFPVSTEIIELARRQDVTIISVPHHAFATARLLNVSIPISYVMETDVVTCQANDLLSEVRPKLGRQRTLPVIDEGGQVVGILSRSDLVKPIRYRLILVDHNERSQAVTGIEEAEILGIIDHHRVADIQTTLPILFRNEAVGATCTILTSMYGEANIPIPRPMAGIMLGAILTDTVLLRSPTSTPRDRKTADYLAGIAGVEVEEFGEEMFAVALDLSGRTPSDILMSDFKEFLLAGEKYGVGYLETASKAKVDELADELLAEMRRLRAERGYVTVLLIAVDIPHAQTEILISGQELAVAEAFGQELATPHSIILPGVMSRKKQVVPILPKIKAS